MECLRWRGHHTKRNKPETMQQQVRDQVLSARWRFFQFTRDFIAFEDHVRRDLQIAGRSATDLPILTQLLWARLRTQHVFIGQLLGQRLHEAARAVSNKARQDKMKTLQVQSQTIGAHMEVVMDTRGVALGWGGGLELVQHHTPTWRGLWKPEQLVEMLSLFRSFQVLSLADL